MIASFMGVFGFVVSFSDMVESALGPRGRRTVRRCSAGVVIIGFVFARDAVIAFFVARGHDAVGVITGIIEESLDVRAPTPSTTTP